MTVAVEVVTVAVEVVAVTVEVVTVAVEVVAVTVEVVAARFSGHRMTNDLASAMKREPLNK